MDMVNWFLVNQCHETHHYSRQLGSMSIIPKPEGGPERIWHWTLIIERCAFKNKTPKTRQFMELHGTPQTPHFFKNRLQQFRGGRLFQGDDLEGDQSETHQCLTGGNGCNSESSNVISTCQRNILSDPASRIMKKHWIQWVVQWCFSGWNLYHESTLPWVNFPKPFAKLGVSQIGRLQVIIPAIYHFQWWNPWWRGVPHFKNTPKWIGRDEASGSNLVLTP